MNLPLLTIENVITVVIYAVAAGYGWTLGVWLLHLPMALGGVLGKALADKLSSKKS